MFKHYCRIVFVVVFVGAALIAASVVSEAQGQRAGAIERFTATSANISNAGEPISIDLLKWSTDADRDRLVSILAWYGEKEMAGSMPTIGYLWTSESAGYSVRFAYRATQPDGGQRIILLTDRRLGGSPQSWKPIAPATSPDYPFTLIELRLNRAGQGEGKGSITNKISVDDTRNLTIENYATAPVLLKGVARKAQ